MLERAALAEPPLPHRFAMRFAVGALPPAFLLVPSAAYVVRFLGS